MKKSAVEKALEARRKRFRDRKRVAKKRSENARRAALIRWGKWDHKRNRPKAISKKKLPKKKLPKKVFQVLPKKVLPKKVISKKKRKAQELERERRRRLYAQKKQKEAEKKLKEAEQKQRETEQKLRWVEEGVRNWLGIDESGKSRFIKLNDLPEKLIHETDAQYAHRVITQMAHEDYYSVEEAYKILAEELEITHRAVFSLWMSPSPIPGAA